MPRAVLGAACAVVIGFYAFAAQSGPLESLSLNPADTYYNLLVRGLRAGQLSLKKTVPAGLLQLADPYDPAAYAPYVFEPYRISDLSYYNGRLYLYWGVTPALTLFWPYAALTGHYLFHRQAVAIFYAIGFLASVGLLRALWRGYFTEVNVGVVAACVFALGLATGVPVLLSCSDVYEVPISCGYMLVMLALGAIWRALHEPKTRKVPGWLVAASVAYGLALGARPTLLFGAVILLVPVVQAWRARRPIGVLLAGATVPITLVGLGLMLYNALRFDSLFEFGLRYQLGGRQQNTMQLFSMRFVWFNLRFYFLEPARWIACFPFVRDIAVPSLPSSRHGDLNWPFGILTNVPVVWLIPIVPLAWRGRSAEARSILHSFSLAVGLFSGICALTIGTFYFAAMRYEVDFLPALVLLAVVGVLGLERTLAPTSESGLARRPAWRRATRWGWGLLLGFSVAVNLLAGTVNYAQGQCYMGTALLQSGKLQEAMEHYELALRINPDLAGAHINLGIALEQMGKFDDAIKHYEEALRLEPDHAEAQNDLGVALIHLGKVTEAMEHYEQALRIKPDFAEAHYDLADALLRLGKVPEAIGQYEQALRIKPDFAEAHNGLGNALHRAGRFEEATAHFEEAVRLKPDYSDGHYNLGVVLQDTGKIREAIEHYQQALRIRPDFAEAKDQLARLRAFQ